MAGLPYWSLASAVNSSLSAASTMISNYEAALAEEARHQGADGVICGHIHHAAYRTIDGIEYCNTGDWVDSCSALVEHVDGRLEVLRWYELQAQLGIDSSRWAREPKSALLDDIVAV